MAIFLSKRELAQTEPAERVAFQSPVPTRIVSGRSCSAWVERPYPEAPDAALH